MADLWPFVPHPNITETLSWFTNVVQTETKEMRYSLRDARQAFRYRFTRSGDHQMIEEAYRGNPHGDWLLPIWTEASKAGNVSAADTALAVDLNADYGAQALIFGGRDNWLVVNVSSVTSTLNLAAVVGQAFQNPTVAPLKTAFITGSVEIRRTARDFTGFGVEFHVRSAVGVSGSGLPLFGGLPYLACGGAVVRPASGSLYHPVEMVDNGMGPVVIEPLRTVLTARYGVTVAHGNSADRLEFKKWLMDTRGRDGLFWMPAWGGRLTLLEPAASASTSCKVSPLFDDVAEYVGRSIKIGSEFRVITGATDDSATQHSLEWASGLTATATTSHLIMKARLDTDRVEINHRRGFAASAQFIVLEVSE